MDDLQEVFEGWLRSRVSGERPGVAPGAVTEGGYDTDVEGMRSWRSDISEFLVWLQANEPEMFGEFRFRYKELDRAGWDAIVGFAGFHDKPAGPPDESQLESDVESLADTPVDDGVPPVSTTAPPSTTTTPPPTTTKPPRTIPVTPDTGPEVTAPPTTTEPPFQYPPVETIPSLPEDDPSLPEDEGSGRRVEDGGTLNIGPDDWGAPPGTPAAGGEGFEARPHTPYGPFAPRRPGDWPWPGGSAGRAIVTNLELSDNGKFLAVVMNDLFDRMNSAPARAGLGPDPRPSAGLSGGQNPSFWAGRVISDQ